MITADDITLELSCSACPEAYDAFVAGINIGYLRLRHGRFTADFSLDNGNSLSEIYEARPEGDGAFEYEEREHYLNEAKDALARTYNSYDM